jgi:hypothetical protein
METMMSVRSSQRQLALYILLLVAMDMPPRDKAAVTVAVALLER